MNLAATFFTLFTVLLLVALLGGGGDWGTLVLGAAGIAAIATCVVGAVRHVISRGNLRTGGHQH